MPILLAIMIVLLAGSASALSCLRPDPAATYQRMASAKETYVVLHGRLTYDEATLPKRPRVAPSKGKRPVQSAGARFKGQALNTNGFVTPFDREIRLELTCAGAWCASIENHHLFLAFVERQAGKFSLTVDPCYSTIFPNPEPAVLDQMQTCFNGGRCERKRR